MATTLETWQRLWKKEGAESIARFSFHDLKAKGGSDFEGDKQKASGHKDGRMVAVYDRKPSKIEATK